MKKVVIPAILMLSSISSHAASFEQNPFYAELNGGFAQLNTDKNINPANHRIGDFAYGARLGYEFPISEQTYFGIEAGYQNLGNSRFGVSPNELKIKQQVGDILAKAGLRFDSGVNVFAKAGAAYVSQKNSVPFGALSNTLNQWKPEVGAGIGYAINDNVEINGSVNHIFADKINANSTLPLSQLASSTSLMAGIKFNFG